MVTTYLMIAMLVLLFIVLVILGRILSGMRRQGVPSASPVAQAPQPAAARAPSPVVQPGIPPQVVAAIGAAVASLEGGAYRIASITQQARPVGRRSAWGQAGVARLTQPF